MGKKSQETMDVEKVDVEVRYSEVPDGGWGWLVCLAGFITQFIVLGIQNNTGILYTALLDEYKRSKGQTGTVHLQGRISVLVANWNRLPSAVRLSNETSAFAMLLF